MAWHVQEGISLSQSRFQSEKTASLSDQQELLWNRSVSQFPHAITVYDVGDI